jgi:DNA polymerase I-like protein with 3'-5' exonuclease and polymerase domains
MRRRGVRVDQTRAEEVKESLRHQVETLRRFMKWKTGIQIDVWAAATIAQALDQMGIRYPLTPKTQKPSITKQLLESSPHWFCKAVLSARQKDKLAGTFIDGVILGNLRNGRVHGEIHPLRHIDEDGGKTGTITGRLSMTRPNLQFIPKRTEEGRLIREFFEPEPGELWCSGDFSQQEPRMLVHFASITRKNGEPLPGALEARQRYRDDPEMNFHTFVAELTRLEYDPAKILNLAIIYGRGKKNTAVQLNVTEEEVAALFERHDREMPFARALSRMCMDVVAERGEIRSLLGRRARFVDWEPADWKLREPIKRPGDMPLWKARKKWPGKRLVRARAHKALNMLIQPSAADQTKLAMRAVWRAKLGRHVMIQIHDEFACTVPDHATGLEIGRVMEQACPQLTVPSHVDVKFGPNWGKLFKPDGTPAPPKELEFDESDAGRRRLTHR